MGLTWDPSGADRTQVGPMLAPWNLLSGMLHRLMVTHWDRDKMVTLFHEWKFVYFNSDFIEICTKGYTYQFTGWDNGLGTNRWQAIIWINAGLVYWRNYMCCVNTLRPRQNGRHFADDTFNRIFVNENARVSIKFSLKFVPKGPMNNIPALVQIMAWRRPGDKPLSGPVMVSLLTHICVTRPQWVKGDLNRFSFTRICAHLISLILYYILYCSNMYEWWA